MGKFFVPICDFILRENVPLIPTCRATVGSPKVCAVNKKSSELSLAAPWLCTLPRRHFALKLETVFRYWLRALKVKIPASVLEHTPAGSTRTIPSCSAQKALTPVLLRINGAAKTV